MFQYRYRLGVKWRNWKMTTKEVETGTSVIKEFATPRLVNLNLHQPV
jgi:hypothetical protein